MVIVYLFASAFMLTVGVVALFFPDLAWSVYIFGKEMEGFRLDVFEQNDGWECYRVILGLIFLTFGVMGLCVAIF
jgi:hypothetical protein